MRITFKQSKFPCNFPYLPPSNSLWFIIGIDLVADLTNKGISALKNDTNQTSHSSSQRDQSHEVKSTMSFNPQKLAEPKTISYERINRTIVRLQ